MSARKLPGGEHQVHVRTVLGGHGGQLALCLFGHAGHDGHAENLLRLHSQLLGEPALGQATKHLLRALGGGQLPGKLRILALEEAHPAGAATGEHGVLGHVAPLEAAEELAALLHDGEVGGEVGVEDVAEAQPAQGGGHTAHGSLLPGQSEGLAPGGAHRGSHLDHGNFVRVG